MKSLDVWALACVALTVKTFALAMLQGAMRVRHKTYVKPEDARTYAGVEPAEAELPLVERAQGALRNDGENVPIFLAVSLAYVLLGCAPASAPWLFGGFVALRYLHGALMLWPRQPWRTLAYGGGLILTLVVCGHVVAAALG